MTYNGMNLFYASQWKSGKLFTVIPFSSKFYNDDSPCITLYILQIHCWDIQLCESGSVTIPSLLLTHQMTVSSTNESNLPRSIWGEGEKDFSQGSKKNTRETNQQKITPKQRLPTLTFAA